MNSTQVAQTILQQLGGKRFLTMTGARNLTSDGNALRMVLPECKHGKTRASVNGTIYTFAALLTAADDYTLTVSAVKSFVPTVIETVDGIYCDQLEEVFTRMTGLYTRL